MNSFESPNNQNTYMRISSNQPQRSSTFQPIDYRKSVDDDIRVSFAADLNPLVQKEGEHHCRSFIATVILVIGIAVPIIILCLSPEDYSEGVAIGIPIAGYVLYLLIGCICNDIHEYIRNIQKGQHFQSEYNRVRALIGQFDFVCECYHYETRYHVRTYTHNGQTRTETYTTTEKVVTHRAGQTIVPFQTTDQSGNVDRVRSDRNIIFIHFIVNYRFIDDQSRNKVDMLFSEFKARNTFDTHQSFNMTYNIPGLVEKMAFYVGDLSCNYNSWYYIFAIIGLIWPYSLWVQSKINRFEVSFMKVLKM